MHSPPTKLDTYQQWQTVVLSLAGAAAAYLRFFWGRLYTVKINPIVSGDFLSGSDELCLRVRVQATNAGNVRALIDHPSTNLFLYTCRQTLHSPRFALPASWGHVATVSLLDSHAALEPGEQTSQELIFRLPYCDFIAVKVAAKVSGYGRLRPLLSAIAKLRYRVTDYWLKRRGTPPNTEQLDARSIPGVVIFTDEIIISHPSRQPH